MVDKDLTAEPIGPHHLGKQGSAGRCPGCSCRLREGKGERERSESAMVSTFVRACMVRCDNCEKLCGKRCNKKRSYKMNSPRSQALKASQKSQLIEQKKKVTVYLTYVDISICI